jgi:hypothetical protein
MFERRARITALLVIATLIAGCAPAATTTPARPVPTEPGPPAVGETWTKTYGGSRNTVVGDVLPADDGGYVIVGTTNLQFDPQPRGDVYLVRTDAAGEVIWEKAYDAEGYHGGQGATWADDGSLLIVGVVDTGDANGIDAYLLKVDAEGNELWSRAYGGPLDEYAGAIVQMPDGAYILGGNIVDPNDFIADPGAAGYGGFEGRSNPCLFKVDANGNEIWSRDYPSEHNILTSGGALTPDGGFLLLATITHFPDPDDDILLTKVDGNGDELWSRTWTEDKCNPYDLVQTPDGNYLITASYVPAGPADAKEDFLFIKVDPEGNEIWRSTFGHPDMIDYGVVLTPAAGGGYVAVGEQTPDHYTWETDIKWVKIDEEGQLIWERARTASHTMFSAILQHPDGGFVVAGGMSVGSMFNIVLIKTDHQGQVAE